MVIQWKTKGYDDNDDANRDKGNDNDIVSYTCNETHCQNQCFAMQQHIPVCTSATLAASNPNNVTQAPPRPDVLRMLRE